MATVVEGGRDPSGVDPRGNGIASDEWPRDSRQQWGVGHRDADERENAAGNEEEWSEARVA